MWKRLDSLRVMILIAFRNMFASRLKTIIVGGIILFGSMLVVVGTALVDSVDAAMSRSIIGSVAGHIQVYSSKSKDALAVMGGFALESPDIAQIEDFKALRTAVMSVANVKDVIPMGLSAAMFPAGNTIDIVLEKLRAVVRQKAAGENVQGALESQKEHVRQIVTVLAADVANVGKLLDENAVLPEEKAAIERAKAPGFWSEFDRDPLGTLEFLENQIAPIATDADMLFLRYIGTDPAAFAKSFDRMKIVDGTTIPPGQRGFLFSKWVYEQQVKMKTAWRLDKIRNAVVKSGRTIARDPELQRWVKQNSTEVKEILLQLDRDQTDLFRGLLQKELANKTTDIGKLLSAFLRVDDGTILRRYEFFYKNLAPHLSLYRVRVGDTLTIKSFTKSGYMQSVNLKVYGTFSFKGLEESHLAGELNLMDMVSFRELYGFLTPDREKELLAIKSAAGMQEVDRNQAEALLFGGGAESAEPTKVEGTGQTAEEVLRELSGKTKREDRMNQAYDVAELQKGVVLNAAVILKDPSKLEQTRQAIEEAGRKANLPLKAIDWQKASGLIGQFVSMIHYVLYISVLIIFAVALVIINNALVMATLERMAEMGTLRAIGAQRRFLLGMLVVEALSLGAFFGGMGVAFGAGIVGILRSVGIPAMNEKFYFFFSGPRLHPSLSILNMVIALGIVMVVSTMSSLYPGFLAMRVSPRQAMQSDE
jgi:ABC-type lipoprotein release transport system permease subunit